MKLLMVWGALTFLTASALAQPEQMTEERLLESMAWRNIGPFRGGRCVAVAGLPNDPQHYYMGTAGGGVWKTEDAGLSWENISDGFFGTGSIGAIAIAPSDPNIIYVGTGEHPVRGVMTSAGDGLYKSLDGGRTWQHLGLKRSRHISSIQVHPKNPDLVYVAVQGAVHGASKARGIYRSIDGGSTWQNTLFINETTGAASLSMDPSNPRILYAGLWDHLRTPWHIRSGGRGSGLYRSTDGGLNWEKLSNGLPQKMGKVGVSVSTANSNKVYAVIEADEGGVFASDDRGLSWRQVNNQRVTIARAWYYTKVVADPIDEKTLYVLNAPLLKSTDGGLSFFSVDDPHTDQHALWVNPADNDNLILGNDGGAAITFNSGRSWSTLYNQPTAQLYRVATDNRFPYYIYGGQQDNTTLAIPSRTKDQGIGSQHWYPVAGGESAFIAFDPDEPRLVYGGSYQGSLSVYDQQTGLLNDIMAYPALGLSQRPKDMKLRFNWNAPLVAKPQDPSVLYHAANVVLRSDDGGQSWLPISPDLSRNEPERQGAGGGPFTNEGAGGENYNTISYLACSPHEEGLIWAGTDDGLLHLSRNEGKAWENVTPPGLGEAIINCIEVSPHRPSVAYVVAMKYKFDNFEPLAYVTDDYGKTWSKIVRGLAPEHFLRSLREDTERPGLLYGGTERGFYVSFNGGLQWQQLQLNLPVCPITDLAVKGNELIASTSGRSFWVLDGLEPLRQLKDGMRQRPFLFEPAPIVRFEAAVPDAPIRGLGQNPPNGLKIYYYLPEPLDSFRLRLDILDAYGNTLRSFCNKGNNTEAAYLGGPKAAPLLPAERGLNAFYWDMRRSTLPGVPGIFIAGNYQGSLVPPGTYQLQLTTPYGVLKTKAEIQPDPRLDIPADAYLAQHTFLLSVEAAIKEIHQSVTQMRDIKARVEGMDRVLREVECTQELLDTGQRILDQIEQWEAKLIQPKHETRQDIINFPNQISAELMNLKQRIDRPTPLMTVGAQQRLTDLLSTWAGFKQEMRQIIHQDIAAFNELYRNYQMPAIIVPPGLE